MGKDGDLILAEKVAEAWAVMVRDYVAEMRRQGKITGKLFVEVREGGRKIRVPYHER